MIILIEGTIKEERENPLNELTLDEHYEFYKKQGLDKKDIIKNIAKDRGVNKNEIYMQFINKKQRNIIRFSIEDIESKDQLQVYVKYDIIQLFRKS